MNNAVRFLVFGAIYAGLGFWQGGAFGWMLVWLGASFMLVGRAYASNDVRAFAKRDDGSLNWRRNCLLWPHLLFTWLSWRVYCWRAKEDCGNQVAPGLWIGRRACACELPEGIDLIVDLTAEFSEPKDVSANRTYICVPTLDGTAINSSALERLLPRLVGNAGGVYIHCALGHGRSAAVMAAVLMKKGLAPGGVDEAVALIRKARPGVRLHEEQLRSLRKIAA